MAADIVTSSLALRGGDIFFCDLTAEEYLSVAALDLAHEIVVVDGFFDRLRTNSVIKRNNLSFDSTAVIQYIESNKLENKIRMVQDFKRELVVALKERYQVPRNVFAVTGTKGKTSTAWYIFNLLNLCGLNTAYFGSIGFYKFDSITRQPQLIRPLDLTTPSIDEIYRIMDESCRTKCDYVIFEASNHAVDQGRFLGISIDCSTFTNIGNDHLDYFKTFEAGFNAKKKLFSDYTEHLAVLNSDIEEYSELYELCYKKNLNIISYGNNGDVKLLDISLKNFKQNVCFSYRGKEYNFLTEIVGSFQVYNILAAVCNLLYVDVGIDDIVSKLHLLEAPRGRLELVKNSFNKMIYVDHSHNPESLFVTIKSLKELVKNCGKKSRVITVFGCGGNRDRIKRPVMGFISTRLADISIITNDNIRNEDENFIIEEIKMGIDISNEDLLQNNNILPFKESMENIKKFFPDFYNYKKNDFFIEKDRRMAIKKGIDLMMEDDILLIAGKGHEDYQIIGNTKVNFDDREVALECLI